MKTATLPRHLLAPALLLVSCVDGADSEDTSEPTLVAPQSCAVGTHLVPLDPDVDLGEEGRQYECQADETCEARDCGEGTCIAEEGVATCLCAPDFDLDESGTCVPVWKLPGHPVLAAEPRSSRSQAVDEAGVEFPSCNGEPESFACRRDIPMTGSVDEAFRAVDLAMTDYMKDRCIGSGALAIQKDGRVVYKRGFGHMSGRGSDFPQPGCGDQDDDPGTEFVMPDTPMRLGSVSKYLTATMARRLVADEIGSSSSAAIEGTGLLDDGILPDHLADAFAGNNGLLCNQVTVPGNGQCVRQCGFTGPDTRMNQITIGQLIGHRSGLGSAGPGYSTNIVGADLERFHGRNSANDPAEAEYIAEHNATVAANPGMNVAGARQQLRQQLGLGNGEQVYFLDRYGADPEGLNHDDYTMGIAHQCLSSDPGSAYRYSNNGYYLLDRIVAHLSPHGRLSAPTGRPELHEQSELHDLLSGFDLESGASGSYSIFHNQRVDIAGFDQGTPEVRNWNVDDETYYEFARDPKRPFCVWSNGSCSYSEWSDDSSLRPNWNFESAEVPIANSGHATSAGQGALVAELPALVSLLDDYQVGNENLRMGRPQGAMTSNRPAFKNGSHRGVHAYIGRVGGSNTPIDLTLRVSNGRLFDDYTGDDTVTVTEPNDVDFAVSVGQNNDVRCEADDTCDAAYGRLRNVVRWAISQVDWNDVEAMVEKQKYHPVGMSITPAGDTVYHYEDDDYIWRTGRPDDHGPMSDGVWEASYGVPGARNGSDIIGVGVTPSFKTYVWYRDGHRTAGSVANFDIHVPSAPFTALPGKSTKDIQGMAISKSSRVYTWYKDGKRSWGTSTNLDHYGWGYYTVPSGKTFEDIAAVAIDKSNDHVFVRYHDGSVSEGTSADLDDYGYTRSRPIGMGMTPEGDTVVWYETGWYEVMEGTLRDNQYNKTVLDHGYSTSRNGPEGIVAVSMHANGTTHYALNHDGKVTVGMRDQLASSSFIWDFGYPTGQNRYRLRGAAQDSTSKMYSWYSDKTLAMGSFVSLDADGTSTYSLPPGKFTSQIGSIAIDTADTGHVWVLYTDGAVSEGTFTDLDAYGYWGSPGQWNGGGIQQ